MKVKGEFLEEYERKLYLDQLPRVVDNLMQNIEKEDLDLLMDNMLENSKAKYSDNFNEISIIFNKLYDSYNQ